MRRDYLPISRDDMNQRGWEQCDFVYVTGDAYVDHPSFGPAIISRVLESNGYKVGIIAQPDWKDSKSITILGEPRLGFIVSGGNMDSMVNHYSVAKKHRQMDAFSPGGQIGKRPDYATVVYCNMIRKEYKNAPVVIGGIEASLRRLAHYDYWSDKVKRSILLDSQADIISYGMGEHSIVEIADALSSGIDVKDITFINGTVFKARNLESVYDAVELPSFDSILNSKKEFARSFYIQYCNTDPFSGKRLVEKYKDNEYVVQNPPSTPLTQAEMDRVYSLPYMRDYHPSYQEAGGIPAIEEVKFSLVSNRGCYGGCNYCALTFHQGRILQTRSHESIIAEANQLIWDKDFKGYIHDVGGPTANFRHTACEKQNTKGACVNKQCLFPTPCKSLKIDHSDYLSLLRKLRSLPKVKKVFIRSGIRFDYLVKDKDETFFKELCEHHVSGQLKVAPEHISDSVLSLMGKPENSVYEEFLAKFKKTNEKLGKNQFVVPYLISSHPGSTLKEAVELAEYLRDLGYMPEQVQDFYPTPSTISTCMYYTGLDPRTLKEVYVPKSPHEKAMQRALIQYRNPKNYNLVVEALTKSGRTDLIGFDKKCLIRPRQLSKEKLWVEKEKKSGEKKDSNWSKASEGRSRSAASTSKTYEGKNRSAASTSKTYEGKSRSAAGTSKTYEGKSRSAAGTSKTYEGIKRSAASTSKTFESKNRSTAGTGKTYEGKSRSAVNTSKTSEDKNRSIVSTRKTVGNYRLNESDVKDNFHINKKENINQKFKSSQGSKDSHGNKFQTQERKNGSGKNHNNTHMKSNSQGKRIKTKNK